MSTQFAITQNNLDRFIEAVQAEYWMRPSYDDYSSGLRQINTVRLVACQVLERLSQHEQLAVVQELYALDAVHFVRADPREIFAASDSIRSHIFDLACEVVWQILMRDLAIRVEDEIRVALAEA